MKRTISILSLCILLNLMTTICVAQSDHEKRVKSLNECTSQDSFMTSFLTYIKLNNYTERLISYEDELIKRKYIVNTSEASTEQYLRKLVKSQNDNRCLNKTLLEKIKPLIFNFNYSDYEVKVKKKGLRGSKEYNFIEYLKSGEPMWRNALEYALENNKITLDKKYFYLLMTTPYKSCK